MSRNVVCASPQTTVSEIAITMRGRRLSCTVIVEDGVPVGIITERDLVGILIRLLDGEEFATLHASDFMTADPVTVSHDLPFLDALAVAQAHRIRHLPVTAQDGRLVGIVTHTDLARSHHHLIERQRDVIERLVGQRTKELKEANDELHALSLEDALLGIGNRRAMEADLHHTHDGCRHFEFPYSVVLFDVDYFKKYNDHYGHARGDETLRRVADCLSRSVRSADRLYRYGGEELLLLLPDTQRMDAGRMASRLVAGLARMGIEHCESPYQVVTLSAGAATMNGSPCSETSWCQIVERADQALYQAKRAGRNQAVMHASHGPPIAAPLDESLDELLAVPPISGDPGLPETLTVSYGELGG